MPALLAKYHADADPAAAADRALDILFDTGAPPGVAEIVFAILFSFALNLLIAAVYKRTYRGARYSQDYVHTLLILGTVVTLVILVVQGNTATAFGMFAAFSIIRFRRSVAQSRDIGFIFLAMATGLAVGARQYVLALLTVPLVTAVIIAISRRDLFARARVSHRLRVRTGNDLDYVAAFRPAFAEHLERHALKSVETVQAGLMTEVVYEVTLRDGAGVAAFVRALQAANGNNRVVLTAVEDAAPEQADD